jgi:hypothetical protein
MGSPHRAQGFPWPRPPKIRPSPRGGKLRDRSAPSGRGSFLWLFEVIATRKWDYFAHFQQSLYLSRKVVSSGLSGHFAVES